MITLPCPKCGTPVAYNAAWRKRRPNSTGLCKKCHLEDQEQNCYLNKNRKKEEPANISVSNPNPLINEVDDEMEELNRKAKELLGKA